MSHRAGYNRPDVTPGRLGYPQLSLDPARKPRRPQGTQPFETALKVPRAAWKTWTATFATSREPSGRHLARRVATAGYLVAIVLAWVTVKDR